MKSSQRKTRSNSPVFTLNRLIRLLLQTICDVSYLAPPDRESIRTITGHVMYSFNKPISGIAAEAPTLFICVMVSLNMSHVLQKT